MARLFDADPSDFARVSIPLLKFEDADDGSLFVYGAATDGTLDRDEQIIDPEFAAESLRKWFETGANVRVMHSAALYPAGRGVELVAKDGGQWLKSKVVEPTAIKLVKEGVLTAYSVGISRPRIIRDSIAKGGRVVGGETVEVSLVDRPANPSCGVVLAKMAGDTVELLGDRLLGEIPKAVPSPATLAAALIKTGHATGAVTPDAAKRDFDPNVGGGVDRDKLKAKDFVFGDERAFPVVTPGDVPDAVSSWGQYQGTKSFEAFKSALTALARRKGPEFAAKLPAEWTKAVEADLAKGSMDCKGCGSSYDADTSAKFCGDCGKKLKKKPKADKAAGPALAKKKAKPAGPDGEVDDKLGRLKDAVRDAVGAQAKDPDAATDPRDAKVSAHLQAADSAVNAAQSAQTEDMAGDDGNAAKAAVPAPVEGMGYGLRRLHDVLCGAYPWAAVKAAHPGLATGLAPAVGGAAQLLRTTLQLSVGEQMTAADAERLAALSKAFAAAGHLDGVDEMAIAEARAELVKDFRTANPDAPAAIPVGGPQNPDATRWRRPYIASGHANLTASPGQKPRIPDTSHVPDASQFARSLITAGHESDSPGNTGGRPRPVVTVDGPSRPQPRIAPGEDVAKAAGDLSAPAAGAAAVMRAMHDHIADAFPDCCPMAPATADQEYQPLAALASGPDMRATAAPKAASATAELAKAAAADPDLFKAAVAAVVQEVADGREAALRAEYEQKIADLAATHNAGIADLTAKYTELAGQPDPRQAPFRSMAGFEQMLSKRSQEPPVAATDPRIAFYSDWLDSPDPAQREAAKALLRQAQAGS